MISNLKKFVLGALRKIAFLNIYWPKGLLLACWYHKFIFFIRLCGTVLDQEAQVDRSKLVAKIWDLLLEKVRQWGSEWGKKWPRDSTHRKWCLRRINASIIRYPTLGLVGSSIPSFLKFCCLKLRIMFTIEKPRKLPFPSTLWAYFSTTIFL